MSTRNGKIARLPHEVREQLNRRLDDGEPGRRLVEWLNGLSGVQTVLAAEFGGCLISDQNLSAWKAGGFRDWQRQQERRTLVRQLTEDAQELTEDAGGVEASDHLSTVLVAELAEAARTLLDATEDPVERWSRLRELLRELARVRREDHKAGRLQIERERRARERAEEEREEALRREWAADGRLMRRSFLSDLFAQPDLATQALALGQAESLLLADASQPGAGFGPRGAGQNQSN